MGTRSVKRVLRSVLPGPPRFHANFAAPRLIPFLIQQLSPGSVILNLGSGQGVADVDLEALWFSAHYWVNIDLIAHNGATCVADAHQIPLADSSCDLVINQAVLEHVLDPGQVVSEMRRVLRPGGCIYCEVPFLQPYHPSPMDFQRYTLDGIRQLFQDWEELEAGIVAGPGNAVRKILIGWVSLFFDHKLARWAADWVLAPIEALDVLIVSHERCHVYASALYFCGRKP